MSSYGEITRCPGINTGLGYLVGDGYSGATPELDDTVVKAAEILSNLFTADVVIRFNHNRESGGAWLVDGCGDNRIGITAAQFTQNAYELRKELSEEFNMPFEEPSIEIGHITISVALHLDDAKTDLEKVMSRFRPYFYHDLDTLSQAEEYLKKHCFGLKDGTITRRT